MKKLIYFTPIPETGKLSSIITEKNIKELIDIGIVPKHSKFLITDLDPKNDDQAADLYHINYMKFDDEDNPKSVVPDIEMLKIAVLEDIRTRRSDLLLELDMLQFRSSLKGLTDIVNEIECDKDVLRSIPNTLDFSGRNTVRKIYSVCPPELFINYTAKYESKIKRN
jgi:hypothetical protein